MDNPLWRLIVLVSFVSLFGCKEEIASPPDGSPTVTYAGKTYTTVQVGTQRWLRENLDVGTMIPDSQRQTNNTVIEKYCYNDDLANCAAYGGLYQWDEAMQYETTEGIRGICPPGWHIPTLAEFQTLDSAVGGDGNALKAIGQGADSGAGTNTSGFSALLAGYHSGGYFNLGDYGRFWSSSAIGGRRGTSPAFVFLGKAHASIDRTTSSPSNGHSVRCLED